MSLGISWCPHVPCAQICHLQHLQPCIQRNHASLKILGNCKSYSHVKKGRDSKIIAIIANNHFCCFACSLLPVLGSQKKQCWLQAQPIKAGHAVAIQPSSAPLTVPDAPQFALSQRSISRQAFDAAVAQKQKQAEVMLCIALHSIAFSGSTMLVTGFDCCTGNVCMPGQRL